jgi:precorrin-6B methylase 1
MSADIPMEMEVDVTLEKLGAKTRLTLEQCGLPNEEIRESTIQGWNEAFNKLEKCLA